MDKSRTKALLSGWQTHIAQQLGVLIIAFAPTHMKILLLPAWHVAYVASSGLALLGANSFPYQGPHVSVSSVICCLSVYILAVTFCFTHSGVVY